MVHRFVATTVAMVGLACAPSYADQINILTASDSASNVSAAIGGPFQLAGQRIGTGSGVLNPFLTIQNTTTEQGYNTSLGSNNPNFDTKRSGSGVTSQLFVQNLGFSTISGVSYAAFYLDANQNGGTNISINQIQIFQSKIDRNDGTLTSAAGAGSAPVLGFPSDGNTHEVFRMNNANDPNFHEIIVNPNIGPGSGDGDVFIYVPASDFNAAFGSFITFYADMGTPPGSDPSNDGFEEFGTAGGPPSPPGAPAPANLILAAAGIAPLGLFRWLRRRKA